MEYLHCVVGGAPPSRGLVGNQAGITNATSTTLNLSKYSRARASPVTLVSPYTVVGLSGESWLACLGESGPKTAIDDGEYTLRLHSFAASSTDIVPPTRSYGTDPDPSLRPRKVVLRGGKSCQRPHSGRL